MSILSTDPLWQLLCKEPNLFVLNPGLNVMVKQGTVFSIHELRILRHSLPALKRQLPDYDFRILRPYPASGIITISITKKP